MTCITRECGRPAPEGEECLVCGLERCYWQARNGIEKRHRALAALDAEGLRGDARTREFWEERES